ncbi:MAG TPA: hypothetical protein VHE34_02545 [Puia sp.]|uniref:hypothetical protein n=1 Tax=Puia sp. TaxID=2045100 RepID=UPI002D09F9A6|nr:hypothetical protein [Puia sp.]HVU94067.1 hypothetical protein [Puia sp.]
MGPIKKIQYDCRQATYLIEKGQHSRLTLAERVKLAMHLSGCSVCRLFRQQSRLINRMMRGLFQASASGGHVLDESVKREMQEKINRSYDQR